MKRLSQSLKSLLKMLMRLLLKTPATQPTPLSRRKPLKAQRTPLLLLLMRQQLLLKLPKKPAPTCKMLSMQLKAQLKRQASKSK